MSASVGTGIENVLSVNGDNIVFRALSLAGLVPALMPSRLNAGDVLFMKHLQDGTCYYHKLNARGPWRPAQEGKRFELQGKQKGKNYVFALMRRAAKEALKENQGGSCHKWRSWPSG
ncbi:hypothetical protein EPI10_000827 [Gossypium australe]|uniref:Uncharacterized protein n=1 Tax=Gossypium australe TaxID=47621 RepID=A0A5B6V9D3_9ROSI|nr:hypothetical protein EPI10_000827 [Gossypium australe]